MFRRRTWHALRALRLVLVAAVVGGCPLPFGPDDADDLAAARRRWRAAALEEYRFQITLQCYCGGGGQPMLVHVRDGAVVGVAPVDPGAPRPLTMSLDAYYSVERLFETIERAIARDAHELRVTYHPRLGYPVDAYIDLEKNTVDEEFGWRARALVAVAPN